MQCALLLHGYLLFILSAYNSFQTTTTQNLHRGVLYLGWGFTLLVLPVLLAVGVLLVTWLVAGAIDKSHVVVVGAGGPGQDAHEVTVVAQVLQQAGHPTRGQTGRKKGGYIRTTKCFSLHSPTQTQPRNSCLGAVVPNPFLRHQFKRKCNGTPDKTPLVRMVACPLRNQEGGSECFYRLRRVCGLLLCSDEFILLRQQSNRLNRRSGFNCEFSTFPVSGSELSADWQRINKGLWNKDWEPKPYVTITTI